LPGDNKDFGIVAIAETHFTPWDENIAVVAVLIALWKMY
jgi:hypothetical protein